MMMDDASAETTGDAKAPAGSNMVAVDLNQGVRHLKFGSLSRVAETMRVH
jgi:hypothetical protein